MPCASIRVSNRTFRFKRTRRPTSSKSARVTRRYSGSLARRYASSAPCCTRLSCDNPAAVTLWSRFCCSYGQLEAFRLSDSRHGRRSADAFAGEQPMQVVDAVHRFAIERHDNVTRLQSCSVGGTTALDRGDQHTTRLDEAMCAHGKARQRHILAADTNAGATHVPERDQLTDDELHRVDRDRKADALRGQDDGGVDTDDVAARVEQRTA